MSQDGSNADKKSADHAIPVAVIGAVGAIVAALIAGDGRDHGRARGARKPPHRKAGRARRRAASRWSASRRPPGLPGTTWAARLSLPLPRQARGSRGQLA
jgi:hypothetical protein